MKLESLISFIILFLFILLIAGGVYYYYNFIKLNDKRLLDKIKIAYEFNNTEKMNEYIAEFISNYPESQYKNEVLILASKFFFQNKEYKKSEKYIYIILSDNKLINNVYVEAANILGKIKNEYEIFDPVVVNYLENAYYKADPKLQSEININLGYQYLYKKDYKTAINYFSRNNDENSYIGLARVYIEMGNYPDAIEIYKKYFELFPYSEKYEKVKKAFLKQCFYYSKFLKDAKKYEMSILYFLTIVNTFPNEDYSDIALYEISDIYYINKDYNNALDFLNKVLVNQNTYYDEQALYKKAIVMYEISKKRESLQLFKKFKELYPASSLIKNVDDWIEIISKDLIY